MTNKILLYSPYQQVKQFQYLLLSVIYKNDLLLYDGVTFGHLKRIKGYADRMSIGNGM